MINSLIQLLNNFGLPQEFILKTTFYIIAALTVFFALRIVTSRNIFHSAISLALTLIGIACVYLYLDAEFLAVVQVLIYVGAIVTLIIFAIMLTASIQDRAIRQANHQVFISAIVCFAFLFLFIGIIKKEPWQIGHPCAVFGIKELGKHLMSTYALPFEFISLVLLVALVAAIVIAKARKEE